MEVTGNRTVKSSLFCSIFNDRKNALSLYNAINHSHYTDVNGLQIITMSNTLYLGYNEDNAYIVDKHLAMYDHQSTYNPNMPMRIFIYAADAYKRIIKLNGLERRMYGTTLVEFPALQAVVFYNGLEDTREQYELKLSDCFRAKSSVELIVKVYNINIGRNRELLGSCDALGGYAIFIGKLRELNGRYQLEESDKTAAYNRAVDDAVNYCIENDILKEYLILHRRDVGSMALSDVTVEDYGEVRYQEGVEYGIEQGIKQGVERGIKQGVEQGIKQGIVRGIITGKIELLREDGMTSAEIAERLGMSIVDVENIMESF